VNMVVNFRDAILCQDALCNNVPRMFSVSFDN
jgi:hypothetical protein